MEKKKDTDFFFFGLFDWKTKQRKLQKDIKAMDASWIS